MPLFQLPYPNWVEVDSGYVHVEWSEKHWVQFGGLLKTLNKGGGKEGGEGGG